LFAVARKRAGGAGGGPAKPGAAAAPPAAAPAPAPAPAAAASEWQAVQHPETGATYYYNPTTGETAWELPA
jgi:hypothetical protein